MSNGKHKNPYREGSSYHKIFDFIRQEQIVTRPKLMEKFPEADVTVVLSPQAEGNSRGDPRGNISARGEVYYMERLKKKQGEPQRFRLRWREKPLDKMVRPPKKEVHAQKSKKKVETEKSVGKAVETLEKGTQEVEKGTKEIEKGAKTIEKVAKEKALA